MFFPVSIKQDKLDRIDVSVDRKISQHQQTIILCHQKQFVGDVIDSYHQKDITGNMYSFDKFVLVFIMTEKLHFWLKLTGLTSWIDEKVHSFETKNYEVERTSSF